MKAVCFGEVLLDIFPDKARIGGAPLNVASRLSSAGIETEIISRVGEDDKGEEILEYLKKNNVGVKNIQVDPNHPTGAVIVTLDESGSASYEIAYPSAWDKIVTTEAAVKSVREADAFIFGSLVCRDEVSRKTLFNLIEYAKYKVLDINLRPPHYEQEILQLLMQKADFIKLNEEELFVVSEAMNLSPKNLEENLLLLSEKTKTVTVCVTRGSHGAVLLKDGKMYSNSGYKIKVKDTVGAGDSFLSTLISRLLLKNESPQETLDYSCAVGALVAGEQGANPRFEEPEIRAFMNR